MPKLFHDLLFDQAKQASSRRALSTAKVALDYGSIATRADALAGRLIDLGLKPRARVAVYLAKQPETVISFFAITAAGGVFVPVNPLLKPEQVAHILDDSGAQFLITNRSRAGGLKDVLALNPDCRILLSDGDGDDRLETDNHAGGDRHHVISADMAAILYTSGSTGRPKGVVLSHANLIAGAQSVSQYLNNEPEDRLLAVLPFSFDYGLSQLTTAFLVGAELSLMDYLLPQDVIKAVASRGITGLAGVPPLWGQLARLDWPADAIGGLRYLTNTGGRLPRTVVETLASKLPRTDIFLMYGLTEAFRSTYLPPEQVKHRPTSIGKAIPGAEVAVIRPDGSRCRPGEAGELVHRGVHVSLGYWRDPERTAQRFKPWPLSDEGLPFDERAVFSGDQVMMDDEGYLFFVARLDDMIKSSGYRISPTEIEEAALASGAVAECAAFGVADDLLGEAVWLACGGNGDETVLRSEMRARLPGYMVPKEIRWFDQLPRNPNGKIDRSGLKQQLAALKDGDGDG